MWQDFRKTHWYYLNLEKKKGLLLHNSTSKREAELGQHNFYRTKIGIFVGPWNSNTWKIMSATTISVLSPAWTEPKWEKKKIEGHKMNRP